VSDDDHFLGLEEVLADNDRTDRIVGCKASRIPDDVRITGSNPERVLDG